MFRLVSVRPLLRTFKFAANNKGFSASVIVLLFIAVLPARALSADVNVARGEQFTIKRSRGSSFLQWSVQSFDARKLNLEETILADTVGMDRFRFRALSTGDATIDLVLKQSTVFGSQVSSTETVTVHVVQPGMSTGDDTGGQRTDSGAPVVSDEVVEQLTGEDDDAEPSPSPQLTNGGQSSGDVAGLNQAEWNRATELLKTGRYEAARNIIRKQLNEARGTAKRRWHNKLAQSFMKSGQYQRAATVWDTMTQQYSNGPVSKWKYDMARAYRKAGMNNQAELVLLEIRHRHQQSREWISAMIELGEIAIERGNYERARSILETARKPLQGRDNPQLNLRLARMYDRYKPIRNYSRAVRLYKSAGRALKETDPKAAQKALRRAKYLQKNYVNFGF